MSTPVCRITNATGKVSEYHDLGDALHDITRTVLRCRSITFVGVVGSRRRNTQRDIGIVHETLNKHTNFVIVSGACPTGADNHAANYARNMGVPIIEFPAQWDLYGPKRAGFVRNEYIALVSDIIYAQVAPDRTGGTENTIKHAERLNRPVRII